MSLVIGICGNIGSGKTTAAEYIKKIYPSAKIYSFADPLKKIGEIFNFEHSELYGSQDDKLKINKHWGVSGREFLQKVGTDLFRDRLPEVLPQLKETKSVWIELFKIKIKQEPGLYIIPDVRFLDEALAINQMNGFIIRTVRNCNKALGSEGKHASELEIEYIKQDYIINNDVNNLEQSQKNIEDIVTHVFNKYKIMTQENISKNNVIAYKSGSLVYNS
jgi:hypothetical protein